MSGALAKCEITREFGGPSIQVRMSTAYGLIDLVFKDEQEFLAMVAGQHVDEAKAMLAALDL